MRTEPDVKASRTEGNVLRVGSVTAKIVVMNPYTILVSIKSHLNTAFYGLL